MVPQSVDIRIAVAKDADALARIGSTSFRAAYQGTCSSDDLEGHIRENFVARAIQTQIALPGCVYLIAAASGVPAGLAKLRSEQHPDAIPADYPLEIQQFYVAPDVQRAGVGRCLMDAVLDYAGQHDFDGVWLSSWEDADWAVEFYLKRGFTTVGTADFPMGSTVFNDYLMWRPVG